MSANTQKRSPDYGSVASVLLAICQGQAVGLSCTWEGANHDPSLQSFQLPSTTINNTTAQGGTTLYGNSWSGIEHIAYPSSVLGVGLLNLCGTQ